LNNPIRIWHISNDQNGEILFNTLLSPRLTAEFIDDRLW
jgi:hypothetical protein